MGERKKIKTDKNCGGFFWEDLTIGLTSLADGRAQQQATLRPKKKIDVGGSVCAHAVAAVAAALSAVSAAARRVPKLLLPPSPRAPCVVA